MKLKKLTRSQKECVSAHYLSAKQWALLEEMEFYIKVANKSTGKVKFLDKFRRNRR